MSSVISPAQTKTVSGVRFVCMVLVDICCVGELLPVIWGPGDGAGEGSEQVAAKGAARDLSSQQTGW